MHVTTIARESLAWFSHEAGRDTMLDAIGFDDVSASRLVLALDFYRVSLT
jgi:hypothetical protein